MIIFGCIPISAHPNYTIKYKIQKYFKKKKRKRVTYDNSWLDNWMKYTKIGE